MSATKQQAEAREESDGSVTEVCGACDRQGSREVGSDCVGFGSSHRICT